MPGARVLPRAVTLEGSYHADALSTIATLGGADRHDPRVSDVKAAVAAGHPATAAAGREILADGGNAADAAVAATLASCVAETVMTGLAGGGHAIYWDAERATATLVDFFVAIPGIGGDGRRGEWIELEIPFGVQPVRYAVGVGSCGVPGVPAGCGALWRRWGSMPWARLVEPALRLARSGAPFLPSHARGLQMLAPVLTMREGAALYSPGGQLLAAGDTLRQPGLVAALELVRDEGAQTFYRGTVAAQLLALMRERGGVVTQADLAAYQARGEPPSARCVFAGAELLTRADLSGLVGSLERLPVTGSAAERALALVEALDGPAKGDGHTTNLAVVDGHGNACDVTTSLGLGSGDYLPGLDIHLNSMLGETDLVRRDLEPGDRMASNMAPTLALDRDGLILAAGAAGGTRIRSALTQVLSGVLAEEVEPQEAVDRPRLHPLRPAVHVEPGFDESALAALMRAGWDVRRWDSTHHYFGGVSLVSRWGAAADPRRDGQALTL